MSEYIRQVFRDTREAEEKAKELAQQEQLEAEREKRYRADMEEERCRLHGELEKGMEWEPQPDMRGVTPVQSVIMGNAGVGSQNCTSPNEIELTQWLRQTWEDEQRLGGTAFFGKLKKYAGAKGSPIIEHYGSGTVAGFKWRTSKGSEGEMRKSTLLNKVSIFKKSP